MDRQSSAVQYYALALNTLLPDSSESCMLRMLATHCLTAFMYLAQCTKARLVSERAVRLVTWVGCVVCAA